jgi:hypothetical protein
MTKLYNIHVYREMRLYFQDIKADSPQQAAEFCKEFHCEMAAGEALDCDGQTFAALVDTQGDFDHSQSVTIEFEAERSRKAGLAAIALLDMIRRGLLTLSNGDAECDGTVYWFDSETPDWHALLQAIQTNASAASVPETAAPSPTASGGQVDVDAILASRKEIASTWSVEDVLQVRLDLNDDQAWLVLQYVDRHFDSSVGINWDTLESAAEQLFGHAPNEERE